MPVSPDKSGFSAGSEYVFKGWAIVSGQGSFAGSNQENAVFTTGAEDTVIQAVYDKEDRYKLTVETELNGEVITTEDKGYYAPGSAVDIEPERVDFDPQLYKYTFEGWIVVSGSGSFADSDEEETVFTTGSMDTVIRAVYTVEEREIRAEYTVLFQDIDTGEISWYYMDMVTGLGDHMVYPDETKVPDGYELYPDDQSGEVTVFASNRVDDYINGYCNPGTVIFTIRKIDDEVTADLKVRFLHYQTEAELAEYTVTLTPGTHIITADPAYMPPGYSVYPERQAIEITVNPDGTISRTDIVFYIAETDPVPSNVTAYIIYNANLPADAIVVSGSTTDEYDGSHKLGERYILPTEFNSSLVVQNYRFVGWSTDPSGDPLYTESYIIPSSGFMFDLFAVWEPV